MLRHFFFPWRLCCLTQVVLGTWDQHGWPTLVLVITSFISDVCISYFFLAGIKYQNQKQIKARSLFWHTFPEGQTRVHQGRHSVSGSRKSADHIFIHKQKTEIGNRKWGNWLFDYFIFEIYALFSICANKFLAFFLQLNCTYWTSPVQQYETQIASDSERFGMASGISQKENSTRFT